MSDLSVNDSSVNDFLAEVIAEEVPVFTGTVNMTQEMKCLTLAFLILLRLWRDNACSLADLERDAASSGLTGRISLQLGRGLGGKGGMRLWRNADKDKSVTLCRENANILLTRLTPEDFQRFCEEVDATADEIRQWYGSLPPVS